MENREYVLTLNEYFIVTLRWMSLKFSGHAKKKVNYLFHFNKSMVDDAKTII